MQAISVVVGVILILRGSNGLSFSRLGVEGTSLIVAGTCLVYLPRLSLFADLVAFVKTKIFVNEDWYATDAHLPTRQDFEELVAAFVNGNSSKRLIMIIAVLFLGGFYTLFSAVLYVVGARKALDEIERVSLEFAPITSSRNSDRHC